MTVWLAVLELSTGNGITANAGHEHPVLRRAGCDTRRAHATSVAVILPVCVVSALAYRGGGLFSWADALPYLPGGLLGALAGAALLPHVPADLLRRIFGLFMLWAAVRLWMR